MKTKLLGLILLLSIGLAYAAPDTSTCSLSSDGSGTLDQILNQYYSVTSMWQSVIVPKVKALFWFFFAAEFLYQITFKKVIANDIQKLYVFFVGRIFVAYMFAEIFLAPSFYFGIIKYFINLGAAASGFSVDMSSGNPFAGFSPSGILNLGNCLWNEVFARLADAGLTEIVNAILYGLPFIFITITVFILSAVMALGLMLTALEAYIVLYGGFILTGFSGSSWTQNYWQRYLSYVGGVAIRLFVTCLIVGIIKGQTMAIFNNMLQMENANWVVFLGFLIKILISTFINAVLVMTIPAKAASMLNGSVSSGIGDIVAGASAALAGVVGGAAIFNAARSGASGMMSAPSVGRTAAMGKARELLSNGASGGTSSKPADWKAQAMKAGTDASTQHMKEHWSKAKAGVGTGLGKMGSGARAAGNMTGGHGGASDLNVNAHRE